MSVVPFRRPVRPFGDPSNAERIAAFREQVVTRIHLMIDLVDEIDGDPDFEPALGWTKTMAIGNLLDIEEDYQ